MKKGGARGRAEERKSQGKSIFKEIDFSISSKHFNECKYTDIYGVSIKTLPTKRELYKNVNI